MSIGHTPTAFLGHRRITNILGIYRISVPVLVSAYPKSGIGGIRQIVTKAVADICKPAVNSGSGFR